MLKEIHQITRILPTPDDSTGTSTGADTTVKTGDMSHAGMYAALTTASLCALLGMAAVYMRRRKDI